MRFSRYVDNRVLGACIRPQWPKWCGLATISETLQVLLNEYPCQHEIAHLMGWKIENLSKGMGTNSVIKGIHKASKGKLKTEILKFRTPYELWEKIKTVMKAGEVLYLHENGHHVLLLGYIEEPKITVPGFLKGMECDVTMQKLTGTNTHTHRSGSQEANPRVAWSKKRHVVLKAEHNIKTKGSQAEIAANKIGSIIVERELEELAKELLANQERLHLVRVYKSDRAGT